MSAVQEKSCTLTTVVFIRISVYLITSTSWQDTTQTTAKLNEAAEENKWSRVGEYYTISFDKIASLFSS